MAVLFRNVTASKHAGEALRASEAQLAEFNTQLEQRVARRTQQLQVLFEGVQTAPEAVRKRLAESLHNGIGHILYATKLRLDRLHAPILGTHPLRVGGRRETDQLLSKAIQQTRTRSHELVPMVLEDFGLVAALQDISRKMSRDCACAATYC